MKSAKILQSLIILSTILIIIALSGCTTPSSTKTDIALTVVDISDEEHQYTINDLKEISSINGYGSFVKTGSPETPLPIVGPYSYIGINLTKLIENLHELTFDFNLVITASDNYQITFTKDQVFGNFYNYEEDTITKNMQKLTPILAYESSDDLNLEPLRMVIIDPQAETSNDAPITEGHFWIKNVVRLEIIHPENFWEINLIGAVNKTMDRNEFESGASCDTHKSIWEENDTIYEGMPLWVLISLIDDIEDEGRFHHNFNFTEAANNYSIILHTKNGTEYELGSNDVLDSYNNAETKFSGILLIYKKNSVFLQDTIGPLCLRGSMVSDKFKINQITEIRLEGLSSE